MAELRLTEEQKAVVENRGGSLLVSAAAGSTSWPKYCAPLSRRVNRYSSICRSSPMRTSARSKLFFPVL